MIRPPPRSTLFPTRRSSDLLIEGLRRRKLPIVRNSGVLPWVYVDDAAAATVAALEQAKRSEEHTSELQSLTNLVCRLLLEKKKKKKNKTDNNKRAQL